MHSVKIETTAVLLGSNAQLFAMRTAPAEASSRIGVVIFNAGMLHNIGPFRLHVGLANELGMMGFPVLRLDQSGKGESPLRTGVDWATGVLIDYDDALAHLATLGVNKTILIGLCSGAADALLVASERSSVAGLVLLDGYCYKTIYAVFRHYAVRILTARAWFRALKRLIKRRSFARAAEDQSMLSDVSNYIDHAEFRQRYLDVLRQNTKILSVFSGGQNDYNHVGQLAGYLSRSSNIENLQELFFADCDHTYTITQHRRRLKDTIKKWTEKNFPPVFEVARPHRD